MKKILQSLALLMALLVPVSANAAYAQLADGVNHDGTTLNIGSSVTLLGDVNCDGFVNIEDVTNLIDYLLGNHDAVFNTDNADTDVDGNVNIADVTSLIDYLLNGYWPGDEPVFPEPQIVESVYESETDTHFLFDINMENDSSSIYMYNIVFALGEAYTPAMDFRVDAPCTVDGTGKIFTLAGSGITPYALRGETLIPMPTYQVNNLNCTVNTGVKTFSLSFDFRDIHYENSGTLK